MIYISEELPLNTHTSKTEGIASILSQPNCLSSLCSFLIIRKPENLLKKERERKQGKKEQNSAIQHSSGGRRHLFIPQIHC